MPHGHNLVQQAMVANAFAVGTLAGRTALDVESNFTATTATFLMKRIRYILQLTGRTLLDDGPLCIGIAHENASIAEIAAAMVTANTSGPLDVSQSLNEDKPWVIVQDSVVPFYYTGDGTEGHPAIPGWISFKKGIPAVEGSGFKLFVYNAGNGALATGVVINGMAQMQGVWLRD